MKKFVTINKGKKRTKVDEQALNEESVKNNEELYTDSCETPVYRETRFTGTSPIKRVKSNQASTESCCLVKAEGPWSDCDRVENYLRLFDLNPKFGPCIGITRVRDCQTCEDVLIRRIYVLIHIYIVMYKFLCS